MFLVVVFEQYCTLLYKLQRYVGRCVGRFEGLASGSKARITNRKHKVVSPHFQMIKQWQSLVNLTINSTLVKDAFQDLKIKMWTAALSVIPLTFVTEVTSALTWAQQAFSVLRLLKTKCSVGEKLRHEIKSNITTDPGITDLSTASNHFSYWMKEQPQRKRDILCTWTPWCPSTFSKPPQRTSVFIFRVAEIKLFHPAYATPWVFPFSNQTDGSVAKTWQLPTRLAANKKALNMIFAQLRRFWGAQPCWCSDVFPRGFTTMSVQ